MINYNESELNNFDTNYFLNLGELVSVFQPSLLSDKDIERSFIVAEEMKKYDKIYSDKKVDCDLNTLLSSAIYGLEEIGCIACVSDTVSLLNGLDYYYSKNSSSYLFATLSQAEITKAGTAKKAKAIILPSRFASSSKYFMGHELTHILKERNPKECKNIYTVQEMVPILVELMLAYMSYDEESFIRLVDDRFYLIAEEARSFLKYKNAITNEKTKKNEALKIAMSVSNGYLTSFYYAISLFQYFLNNPRYIADLVSAVTRMKITTNDMINIIINKYTADAVDKEYHDGIQLLKKAL